MGGRPEWRWGAGMTVGAVGVAVGGGNDGGGGGSGGIGAPAAGPLPAGEGWVREKRHTPTIQTAPANRPCRHSRRPFPPFRRRVGVAVMGGVGGGRRFSLTPPSPAGRGLAPGGFMGSFRSYRHSGAGRGWRLWVGLAVHGVSPSPNPLPLGEGLRLAALWGGWLLWGLAAQPAVHPATSSG